MDSPTVANPLSSPGQAVSSSRVRFDATSLLTIYFVVLMLVPVGYVFGPLGAAGRPAGLVGVVAFIWWGVARFLPRQVPVRPGFHQVRVIALVFFFAVLASYLAAFLRPIDGIEGRSADRGIIVMMGLVGPLLLAADQIRSRERLDTLLRRLATAGAALAAAGALQFFTGYDLSKILRFPGLTELGGFQGIQERSGLNRVAATAAHPIEFGVVLALIFPLALHFALHAQTDKRWAWVRVGLISSAIPFAVARSGVLAFAIAFLTMWFSWPGRLKFQSAVVAGVGTVVMRAFVPGLLGTIGALFTNLFYDPSTQGRLQDYGLIGRFFDQGPLFGRGFLTFLPDRYILLDNQYLMLIVETGVVGTAAFVLLFLASIGAARIAKRGADVVTRSLGQAFIAASLAVLIAAGTFDLLSFSMVAGVSFLIVGCSGALWRLTGPTPTDTPSSSLVAIDGAPTQTRAPSLFSRPGVDWS